MVPKYFPIVSAITQCAVHMMIVLLSMIIMDNDDDRRKYPIDRYQMQRPLI